MQETVRRDALEKGDGQEGGIKSIISDSRQVVV